MISFVFRILFAVTVAAFAVAAVVDATRSIGASNLVLTSLGEGLDLVAPQWAASLADWLQPTAEPDDASAIVSAISAWPMTVVLSVAAIIFAYLGRPARPRRRRSWIQGSVSPSRMRR